MWQRIKRFFKDSETIFWARLQTALGFVVVALTYVDPSVLQPIIPAQYFPWLLVANGILTEYLRRRREDSL
ncbi:hypothetical protein ACFWXH_14160 [Mesorhizobium sp. NPDC059054]|uniref:hypothetical protein n=1 Tax=Mesorhizobium sp. NPDC059054 TaxID=3346711 RepID=UPI00367DC559